MSANPPLPTPVTPESIVDQIVLPLIRQTLLPAVTGAMGGPEGAIVTAVIGSVTLLGPQLAAQIVAAQNTPATAAAEVTALTAADAAVAAEKAAGA